MALILDSLYHLLILMLHMLQKLHTYLGVQFAPLEPKILTYEIGNRRLNLTPKMPVSLITPKPLEEEIYSPEGQKPIKKITEKVGSGYSGCKTCAHIKSL